MFLICGCELQNLCTLADIEWPTSNKALTECLMSTCQQVLLSHNIQFSIEKASVLPSI